MIHKDCGGTGILEELGEYRMKCDCKDGIAVCCVCGDYATREDDEGKALCDPHYFLGETEEIKPDLWKVTVPRIGGRVHVLTDAAGLGAMRDRVQRVDQHCRERGLDPSKMSPTELLALRSELGL